MARSQGQARKASLPTDARRATRHHGAMDHDALSKSLFALPPVEADLLRIVARGWVHLLDLDSLERISAEHPAADQTQRVGDLAWRVRFREGRLADGTRPWLLQPTELQSSLDPRMAERQLEYARRHIGALRREGVLSREGEEPRLLPVVVYDGPRRWRPGLGPPGAPIFLQPGGYVVLLDAGAGELEDWPADNRVSSSWRGCCAPVGRMSCCGALLRAFWRSRRRRTTASGRRCTLGRRRCAST